MKIRKFSGSYFTIPFTVNNSARTTKKILIACGVVVVFFAYSFIIRHHRSGPIVAPSSPANSGNQSASTGSNTSNTNPGGKSSSSSTTYKDGSYTGTVANAYYGNVQVKVTISSGKITSVNFLQYPNDNPNSSYISSQATPYLKQEAIQAQTANVNIITGATFTSQAFMQTMASALSQAKA